MSYRPNSGFVAQLRRDPRTLAAIADVAHRAQAHAQSFAAQAGAPWMPRSGGNPIVVQIDGAHVRLTNTDYAGHLIEFGSINNPPHAPLRRGVRAAGVRLQEHGK